MVKWTADKSELRRRQRQSARDTAADSSRSSWQPIHRSIRATANDPSFFAQRSASPAPLNEQLGLLSQPCEENIETMSLRLGSPTPSHTAGSMEFAKSFKDPTYSDITLYLGSKERELKAHRLVLASASSYFDRALRADYVETESKEFRFHEHGSHALWRVFEYMYTRNYSDEAIVELEDDGKSPKKKKR
jgi:BTB/POZ domain